MGLDIYLFRLIEPDLDTSKIYTESELEGYHVIPINELEERFNNDVPHHLLQTIQYREQEYDYDKVSELFKEKYPNIGTFELYPVGYSSTNDGILVTFYDTINEDETGSALTLTVKCSSVKELEEKLCKEVLTDAVVFKVEEIAYQRKGLNDVGWELLLDNCSYCMDKNKVSELVKYGGLSETFLDNWIDGETALCPWW